MLSDTILVPAAFLKSIAILIMSMNVLLVVLTFPTPPP